jgi:subtilisin family serine protease
MMMPSLAMASTFMSSTLGYVPPIPSSVRSGLFPPSTYLIILTEGRARWGATFGPSASADGNGHGTHVAGTVGGSQFGVAKRVMFGPLFLNVEHYLN